MLLSNISIVLVILVYTNADGPDPSPRLNLVLIEEPAVTPAQEKSISDQEIDRVWSQIV